MGLGTSQATVTIPLTELDEIKQGRAEALEVAGQLRKDLEAARLDDKTGKLKELNVMIRECLTVVRFAIANLPAETTKAWPSLSLRAIANGLAKLPDRTVDDIDFATLIKGFRKDIAECEMIRAAKATLPEDAAQAVEDAQTGLDEDPARALQASLASDGSGPA